MSSTNCNWLSEVEEIVNHETGDTIAVSSRKNIMLILENDEKLKGIVSEDLNSRILIKSQLPWYKSIIGSVWSEADDAELRLYMEIYYGIESPDKISDCLRILAHRDFIDKQLVRDAEEVKKTIDKYTEYNICYDAV